MAEATICIFAKPPVAYKAKTRLASVIGASRAAALAEAFLHDTVDSLRRFEWANLVIAATERFERPYIPAKALWLQPEGTLDERLEAIITRALQLTPSTFAVGADSPGLPAGHFEEARSLLGSCDAVLGPSLDGGFYLLGVKRWPAGLLQGVEWSQSSTMRQTMACLQQQGFTVALLPEWFDVDTVNELSYLEKLVASQAIHCPHTQAVLQSFSESKVTAGTAK